MKFLKSLTFLTVLLMILIIINKSYAIECDPNVNLQGKNQQELTEFQNKCQSILNSLGQKASSLSQQIRYMDTQISLILVQIQQTEQKIITTQKEIEELGTRIEGLDQSLTYISKLIINKIVEGYKKRSFNLFNLLFDSNNVDELIARLKYLKTTQNNNQKILIQLQETKSNFEEQKSLREEKKVKLDKLTETLTLQEQSLNTQKAQKQKLLAETNNDEATYQKLLSQAKAQLASFGRFVQSQGGASLLSNQTVCDDWGCYYNQRDSQWGSNSLNGTNYTLASDGCLVTSMAMVYTHLGKRNVTPQTINSNPNNFASYYPAYLQYTISADGLTTSRISAAIDSTLASGDPVVIGVNAYGGTHFVVLISGSDGNYIMNDPYIENGHKISFNNYYSVGNIFEIRRVITQ